MRRLAILSPAIRQARLAAAILAADYLVRGVVRRIWRLLPAPICLLANRRGIVARVLAVSTALALGTLREVPAVAQSTYQFANIADTSGAFSFFERDVAINDGGTVAFVADLDTGVNGVFTGSGGPTTTIADNTGEFIRFFNVNLNNSGFAAFGAFLDGRELGIFSGSGGPTTTIVMTGPGSPFEAVYDPSINAAGEVSFPDEKRGIYVGDGGPVATIADESGELKYFGPASINDGGIVAFGATFDSGKQAILVDSGGSTVAIADSSGPFSGFWGSQINNSGTVVFGASLDDGGDGVFTGNGGSIATVADDSGPYRDFGVKMAINDLGVPAFTARLDGDGDSAVGIYTGADPVANKVVRVGDGLFGSTLVELYGVDINDVGAVAFRYLLANGTSGVAVASVVPEPGGGAIVGGVIGVVGFVSRRRVA